MKLAEVFGQFAAVAGTNGTKIDRDALFDRALHFQHPSDTKREIQQQTQDKLRDKAGRFLSSTPSGETSPDEPAIASEEDAEAMLDREIAKLG